MADVEQCRVWLNDAHKLIGTDGVRRTNEVAELLTGMENILKVQPPKNPSLKTQEQYDEFKKTLDLLKKDFNKLATIPNSTNEKGEGKALAHKLRSLKKQARLELGKANPLESKQVKREMLAAARWKPIYEDRVKQFTIARNRLKSLPGTKKQQDDLTEMLKVAKSHVPDYWRGATALTFLSDLEVQQGEGLARMVNEGFGNADQLPETVFGKKSEFAEAYRKAERLLDEYEKKVPAIDSGKVDDIDGRLLGVLSRAEKNKKEAESLQAAYVIVKELEGLIDQCDQAEESVKNPKMLVENKWQRVGELSVNQGSLLKIEKEKAESLESSQLWTQAADAYKKLLKKIDDAIQIAALAPTRWGHLEVEIREMEKTLESAALFPALSTVVSHVSGEIEKGRKLAGGKDYSAACESVEAVRKDVEGIKKAVGELGKDDGKKPPTIEFPEAKRTVEVKLNSMRLMLEKQVREVQKDAIHWLGQAGGDVSQMNANCETLLKDLLVFVVNTRKEFEKKYDRATRPTNKQSLLKLYLKTIDKEYDDMADRAEKIGEAADAVRNDDGQLGISRNNAKAAKTLKKSLDAIAAALKVAEEIDALHLRDGHIGAKSVKEYRKILAGLKIKAGNGDDVSDEAGLAQEQLKEQKKLAEGEIEGRRKEAKERSEAVLQKIEKLEKEDEKYAPFFNELRTDLASAATKYSSKVATVSAKGDEALNEIEKRIDELKKTLKDDKTNFTAVDKKIESMQKLILAIKDQDPKGHAKVDHAFQKVTLPQARKLLPDKALAKLVEFENDQLKKAQDAGNLLAKEQSDFKLAATNFRVALEKSGLKDTAKELYASMMERREGAKAMAAGSLLQAQNELTALELLLDGITKDPKQAVTLNKDAENEKFEQKRRKEEYEAQSHLFETNYKQQAAEFQGVREDEYKAMKKMADQADKMSAKKPPDFAGAHESLEKAIEMAKFIIENGKDDSSPRGRNLKKLNNSWKNRISVYQKQIVDLADILEAADPPVNAVAIDQAAVHNALDPLLSLFDPKALDKYVVALGQTKPKPELNAHRKTKEEALARIRRMQGQFKRNVVLKHVATNTISKVVLRPLQDTLRGLEAEVLGS